MESTLMTTQALPSTSALGDLRKDRAIANLIDLSLAIGTYGIAAVLSAFVGVVTVGFSSFFNVLGYLAAIGVWFANSGYLQILRGQSIGKQRRGLRIVGVNGEPAQPNQLWGRAAIDFVCFIALAIPFVLDRLVALVSPDGRRFSDNILALDVIREP
jgi:uncharacterized RDD family membrane protein YckC